jgi:hypothetical protein
MGFFDTLFRTGAGFIGMMIFMVGVIISLISFVALILIAKGDYSGLIGLIAGIVLMTIGNILGKAAMED